MKKSAYMAALAAVCFSLISCASVPQILLETKGIHYCTETEINLNDPNEVVRFSEYDTDGHLIQMTWMKAHTSLPKRITYYSYKKSKLESERYILQDSSSFKETPYGHSRYIYDEEGKAIRQDYYKEDATEKYQYNLFSYNEEGSLIRKELWTVDERTMKASLKDVTTYSYRNGLVSEERANEYYANYTYLSENPDHVKYIDYYNADNRKIRQVVFNYIMY